ncbi:AMP-dependent synthetase/ligase [Acidipropionibacterium timonense]|uniref:AMP-dependent synthetase/ligase n=1 Tax=Acidipropionibacterium timonense TaxID=2161818 RepID=UPI00102FC8AB
MSTSAGSTSAGPSGATVDPTSVLLGAADPTEDRSAVHLAHMFRRVCRDHGFRPAVRVRDDGRWVIRTFAQTRRRVDALARSLVEPGTVVPDGLQRGDRIAILAHNRPEWLEVDLAAMTIGVVPVPIYPTSTPDQIVHIVTDSGARAVVVSDAGLRDRVLGAADRMPTLAAVVTMDDAGPGDPVDEPGGGSPVAVVSLATLLARGEVEPGDDVRVVALIGVVEERMSRSSGDDVAGIIYTSGTTGSPKGVMLTHRGTMAEIDALDAFFDFKPTDHSLCFLPLSHALEWGWTMVVLSHGCLNTFVPNPKTVGAMLAQVRPTLFVSVPKLYEQVMSVAREKVQSSRTKTRLFDWSLDIGSQWWRCQEEGRRPDRGLRWRHKVADALVLKAIRDAIGGPKTALAAGGAPLRSEVEEFLAACGILVSQGYGLTEAGPLVSFNCPGAHKFGTAGRPIVGSRIKVGEEGEILYQGPNIMKGYWNQPEATASTVEDGWLHTGDIGHVDDDGYLVITDRLKDIIVTLNGKNIAPQPIEAELLRDPLFEHAVILGDNRPCLTLLVKPSLPQVEELAERLHISALSMPEKLRSPELAEEIRKRVAAMTEKLPHQEQIRDLHVLWDEFTTDNGLLTPTLKVRRHEVEKRFTEVIDEMYGRLARMRKSGGQAREGRDDGSTED